MMFDNSENLGPDEILFKLKKLGYGVKRNKRFHTLCSYSVDLITKEEWIKKYCK